jgi:hypothetical protein
MRSVGNLCCYQLVWVRKTLGILNKEDLTQGIRCYKNGLALNWTVHKRGRTSGQKTYEEMLNILGRKGNANQNYIEIPYHPTQNGYHLEHK